MTPHITFNHERTCPGPDMVERERPNGDVKWRCQACDRFLIVYAHKHQPATIKQPAAKTPPPMPAPIEPAAPRYSLTCCRCDYVMELDRPRPRVPLCQPCKDEELRSHQILLLARQRAREEAQR